MLEQFGLKEDPFPIVPDGPVHNWAGHDELKEDLIDLVKGVRGRDIGVTEFAVLYGEYGAGKSHALRYLKTMIDEESKKADGSFRALALYLERPRVANKLNFLELYKYIVRILGRDRVQRYCERVRAIVSASATALAEAAGLAHVKEQSTFHQAALDQFKANDVPMIRLLDAGADDPANVYAFLAGEKFAPNKEYEGKIDSDFLAATVLSDLFRVLTTDLSQSGSILEAVYLFVDEAEVLVEAKTAESELIFNGLRELINGLPYRFCLLISFSAATSLIEAIMPNHLLKRMTRRYIEVPMLTDEEAVAFLKSQLNFFRPDNSPYANTFYPFEEDAIHYIVESETAQTPRSLFINCKRVLERALRRHQLQPGETITRHLAEQILGSLR